LQEINLPDLSSLHPSVQTQLSQAYATLVERLKADSPPQIRADTFGEMGKRFMVTRFNDEAERCFRNAEALAPPDFRWPYHLEQRVSSTSRRGMTEIPIPDPLISALSGLVQTPQLYRERGLDAAATGNWTEAVKNFRLGVDADPNQAGMRVNLAAALERVSDARGALEQYQQALRLDPDLAEAHFGLGDLLERGGREPEALGAFRAAVAANPNFIAAQL